jgi:hypothetical protein
MKLIPLCALLAAATLLPTHASFAQDRAQDKTQAQTRQTIRDRDIYGSQMMTRAERDEYRQKMRGAATAEERERVRAEHHEQMKERAQARGITLPDEPRAGRGPGASSGGGMGPGGGGMGPGGGGMGPGGGGMGPGGGGMGPGGGAGRGR